MSVLFMRVRACVCMYVYVVLLLTASLLNEFVFIVRNRATIKAVLWLAALLTKPDLNVSIKDMVSSLLNTTHKIIYLFNY